MFKLLFFLLLAGSIAGCSGGISKGVKKDLTTGLSTSYNGFSVEDVYLAAGDKDTRVHTNEVGLNSSVAVLATGVENFTALNGKVYPGCTIILSDKAGKELLHLDDAFADLKDGTTVETSKVLRAQLTTGAPMLAGETYHLKTRFFDKKKKESEIVSSVDILIK